MIHRIPVNRRHLLIHQAFFYQLGEEPLLPAVVAGIAGGELAAPVIGKAQCLQLIAHVIDVLVSPLGRRHLILNGGVFCGHAESVPAHGLHDIFTLHALETGHNVADSVVTHVAHVQLAAGVGEHGEAVELLAVRVLYGFEALMFVPVLLGVAFDITRAVVCVHRFINALAYSPKRGAK